MHFFILAFLSAFMRNICNKEFTKRFTAGETNLFYQAITLTVTCFFSAVAGGMHAPNMLFLIMSTVYAVVFVATVYLMIVCYSKGPMALVSLVLSMSSIVPVLVGLIGFREEMNLFKGIGLVCAFTVLILSWRDGEAKSGKKKYKYIPAKIWLPVTLLCMGLNGILSSLQNMAVQWAPNGNSMIFNFWSYLLGALICWVILLIRKAGGQKFPEVTKSPKSFTALSLLSGVGCAGINLLIMLALVYIPSSICYPLMSTVSTTSVFLLSLLYYKEGHSKFGYIMLVFSLVGIISFSFA